MLTVFFDWEGAVHHEYALPGQTINKEYCLIVFLRLRDAIRQKRLEQWVTGDWRLHHDGGPSCITSHAEFFGETSNHPRNSAPLQPRFSTQ